MKLPSLAEVPVFRAHALDPRLASRAFPLVQLSCPNIQLRVWMDYVRAQANGRRGTGGVTSIQDERGYIHGVFSWNLTGHLICRKSIRISDLVLANLPGRALLDAVLAEIQALAACTGAGAIMVEAGANIGGLHRGVLLANGFRPAGEQLEMVLRLAP
jgi:hypothetical protein